MALNPPLSQQGIPLRVQGEEFILERTHMEVEINVKQLGKFKGKGKVSFINIILTTARMVFVNKDYHKEQFKSFDIPLAFLYNESFKQPIFGANYLEGIARPLYNLLPGDSSFKIWFMQGGCQRFLHGFMYALDEIRKNKNQGMGSGFMNQVRTGAFASNQAFVDPSDPTTFFVTQPQDTYDSVMGKGTYIGTNYNVKQPQQQQTNVPTSFVDFTLQAKQEQQQLQNKVNNQSNKNDNSMNFNYPQAPDSQIQNQNFNNPLKQNVYQQNQQQEQQTFQNSNPNVFNQPQQNINPQQNLQQQNQQQIQQQQQQPQQQMNQAFYYGWFHYGPQLQRNEYQ